MWLRVAAGLVGVALGMLLVPPPATSQQAPRLPQIGWLRSGSPPDYLYEAFRQGLRDLGYVEGRNIAIVERWAEGKVERLPTLAGELVQLKVDVIVTSTTLAIQAAQRATGTIPIVMALSADPVGTGLVASLARPGGNITGLSSLGPRDRRETAGIAQRSAAQAHQGGLPLEPG